MRSRPIVLAAMVVAVVLTGCSDDSDPIDAQVVVSTGGPTGGEARIGGQVSVTPEGCLGVGIGEGSMVVVWPRGSSATSDGVEVDGRRLDVGSSFSGGGSVADADELPPSVPYPASCGDGEVAILDTISAR